MHCLSPEELVSVEGIPVDVGIIWPTQPEPLVVLKFRSETPIWTDDEILALDPKGMPTHVLGPNGREVWKIGVIEPGYSGSPVVDKDGELCGLVHGYRGNGEPLMIRLPQDFTAE